MEKKPQYKTHLFDSYLRGNLSQEDERELADWIRLSENNHRIFKTYIADNQFSASHTTEANHAWENLKIKLGEQSQLGKTRRLAVPLWLKAAAVILIALLSGYFGNELVDRQQNSYVFNEVIVPKGETAQLVLSDGTQVNLNAGTHLKYPASFSKTNRKVILTGEGFFNVAKDKTHPFIIETPKFNVKVTGTSFNLHTYVEDETSSLTLYSGEVTISAGERELKIHPGEKYTLKSDANNSKVEKLDLLKAHLWTEGIIVVNNLELDEICKVLERQFDVRIKIANEKLRTIRYNGQFNPDETLEEILRLIKETSPVKFNYEINKVKKEVILK